MLINKPYENVPVDIRTHTHIRFRNNTHNGLAPDAVVHRTLPGIEAILWLVSAFGTSSCTRAWHTGTFWYFCCTKASPLRHHPSSTTDPLPVSRLCPLSRATLVPAAGAVSSPGWDRPMSTAVLLQRDRVGNGNYSYVYAAPAHVQTFLGCQECHKMNRRVSIKWRVKGGECPLNNGGQYTVIAGEKERGPKQRHEYKVHY